MTRRMGGQRRKVKRIKGVNEKERSGKGRGK